MEMSKDAWRAALIVGHSPDGPFSFARSYKRMTSSYDLRPDPTAPSRSSFRKAANLPPRTRSRRDGGQGSLLIERPPVFGSVDPIYQPQPVYEFRDDSLMTSPAVCPVDAEYLNESRESSGPSVLSSPPRRG